MELTVVERLQLINVLPETGNAATLRIVRDFQKELSFDDMEFAEYEVRNETNDRGQTYTAWNAQKAKPKEVAITPARLKLIQDGLKKLEDNKALTLHLLNVYDKFSDLKIEEKVV